MIWDQLPFCKTKVIKVWLHNGIGLQPLNRAGGCHPLSAAFLPVKGCPNQPCVLCLSVVIVSVIPFRVTALFFGLYQPFHFAERGCALPAWCWCWQLARQGSVALTLHEAERLPFSMAIDGRLNPWEAVSPRDVTAPQCSLA